MTEQTTFTAPNAGQMRFALDLIRWYSIHFPELPAPYITLSAHPGQTVLGIQTPDQAAFEMWREALEFDTENVELTGNGTDAWLNLSQKARQFQVPVHLTCHQIPAVTPRPAADEQVAA